MSLQRNGNVKPADIARVRHELGLDKPWPVRYVDWLSQLLHGDLGVSMHNHLPVTNRILAVLPNTLLLTSPRWCSRCCWRRRWASTRRCITRPGSTARPTFSGSRSTPCDYWLALLMIILFSLKFDDWGWFSFPPPASSAPATAAVSATGSSPRAAVIALGLAQVGVWSSYIRSTMLEALQMDYVRTARSKGLGQRAILYGHALRNAVLPLVTLIGLSIPDLFAGAVFIESIFAWNGIGLLTLNAVSQRDYTMVMGTTLMFSALTMVSNLIADVVYGVLDPRLRQE